MKLRAGWLVGWLVGYCETKGWFVANELVVI
jgi:hypothetical protein